MYPRSETTVTEISHDGPSSSSPCAQWFRKYGKYILASLVAGLSLALILALGLMLSTTATTSTISSPTSATTTSRITSATTTTLKRTTTDIPSNTSTTRTTEMPTTKTTTPGRRKKIVLALKIPWLMYIFSSRSHNNWQQSWQHAEIRCEGGSVQYQDQEDLPASRPPRWCEVHTQSVW